MLAADGEDTFAMKRRRAMLASALVLAPGAAHADTPMSYLWAYGASAYPVTALTWRLLILSVVVIVIIGVLCLGAIFRRRSPPEQVGPGRLAVERSRGGLSWIYIGTGITTVTLVVFAIWGYMTLAAVGQPPGNAALTIEVTGHQWWWEVRYLSDDPSRIFNTANEIHIPTGEPVRFRLTGADVVHSFWVPKLSGKTDTIPGQSNSTWLEASKPGIYRGQCTEYCGQQHAHMALVVVAEPPEQFKAWWDDQLKPPAAPGTQEAADGLATFRVRCGGCHAVRGTEAGGDFGPDLSHLMTRRTIAAGTLPNTPGYLSAWIADPQALKPGSRMPILDLTGPELAHVRSFLETLQ
jgi:cytochrome c oxidase subunit 2